MLVKRLVQLQFCWDKADKLQVMFYFPEGRFTIKIKLWIQNFIVLNVLF